MRKTELYVNHNICNGLDFLQDKINAYDSSKGSLVDFIREKNISQDDDYSSFDNFWKKYDTISDRLDIRATLSKELQEFAIQLFLDSINFDRYS